LIRLVTTNGGPALDLGTGSGLLAMALAAGQASVVATDLNPAALRLTTLNGELNDVRNVRTALGNLFEPVEGETFDLIVSNPPFVIGPASPLLFRHGSDRGDAISRDVLTDAAGRLNEGGFAFVMVNWVQGPDDPWLETLRRWLARSGCDALCLLHQVEEPLAYAVRWNAREERVRPDRYRSTIDRWLRHFEAESITGVGSGAVILRRRAGRNWVHGVELEGDTRGDAGTQIAAMFAARDFLGEDATNTESADGAATARARIAASAFRIGADHRLYQTLAAHAGEYVVEPAALVTDQGLALATAVEPELIPAVLRLDGSQTVADIAREIADATGGDVDALTDGVVGLVRSLLDRGIALPVRGGS
jgi:hypothetical protein